MYGSSRRDMFYDRLRNGVCRKASWRGVRNVETWPETAPLTVSSRFCRKPSPKSQNNEEVVSTPLWTFRSKTVSEKCDGGYVGICYGNDRFRLST